MSTPENKAAAEVAKIKAWYASHTFYAGLIVGALLGFIAGAFVYSL